SGWHPGVGIAGTFTIDSNGVSDNGVDDVASYLYSTLDPPSTPVAAPSLGAPVTVTVTPTRPGLNTLFARSVDRAGNLGPITAYSYAPPNVGTWTHLVGVYDRPANLIRLYVDGVAEGWASWTTPWNATGPLRIGRLKWAGAVGSPFAGDVSDVRVWQRAITGDEALAIASDGVVSRLGQGGATADSSCTATQ